MTPRHPSVVPQLEPELLVWIFIGRDVTKQAVPLGVDRASMGYCKWCFPMWALSVFFHMSLPSAVRGHLDSSFEASVRG